MEGPFSSEDGSDETDAEKSDGETSVEAMAIPCPQTAAGPWWSSFLLPNNRQLDMHNFLAKLAGHWVAKVAEHNLCKATFESFPVEFGTASVCTGTATGEITVESSIQAMSDQYGFLSSPCICFQSEKEPFKQQWLKDNNLLQRETCLFNDCTLILSGKAKCITHGCNCDFLKKFAGRNSEHKRKVHSIKAGFSCKSWSRANCNFCANRSGMAMAKDELTSVKTFRSTRDIIECVMPDTFILENVNSMGDENDDSSNLALVLKELRALGDRAYHVRVDEMLSSNYGIPQTRQREH
jgi:hypothetical protein